MAYGGCLALIDARLGGNSAMGVAGVCVSPCSTLVFCMVSQSFIGRYVCSVGLSC